MKDAFFLVVPLTDPETGEVALDLAEPVRDWVDVGEFDGRTMIHCLLPDDQAERLDGDPAYLGASYDEMWALNQDAAKAVLLVEHEGEDITLEAADAAEVVYTLAQVKPLHQWAGRAVALPE